MGVDAAWRREVASRVQLHRARRRKSADPNALELDFSADEPYSFAHETPPPARFAEITLKAETPKIIRFPRSTVVPYPAVQEVTLEELELAHPVIEPPRIVEAEPEVEPADFEPEATQSALPEAYYPMTDLPEGAPPFRPSPRAEQMELLPNFEDIRLEPEADRLRDQLEVIPRPAPLSQRAVAGAVDAAIVFIASGVFATTFLALAEEMPQSRLTAVCVLAVGGVFWLVFQYMFLIHGHGTPGMRMAQLELCTFEGKPASLLARQCRALASALSGFSAGLGYAWALVDEDRLGWHDRISQTHLRGSGQQAAFRATGN